MNGVPPAFGLAGIIVGLCSILVSFVIAARKSNIDESTLVLGKWKELVEQHEKSLKLMREEQSLALAEIKDLRDRLGKAEGRIRQLEDENTSLKRALAQHSQSTAMRLGDPEGTAISAAARKKRGDDK